MESVSRDRVTRIYVSSLPLLHSGNKMLYLCHYKRAGAYRVGRIRRPHFLLLHRTKEQVHVLPVFVCLSVCQRDSLKTRAWICMKCRVSTNVGTWTTDQLFSPIRIIVRIPEPDCFLRYRISAATRNFITSGKCHVYTYWPRAFKMVLFTASRRNTFVGGTCALPSALLHRLQKKVPLIFLL